MFKTILSYATLLLLLLMSSSSGNSSSGSPQNTEQTFNPGPDAIAGDMSGLAVFGTNGTQNGVAIGLTTCNAGNQFINYFAIPDTRHPAVASNLYRMSGGTNNNDRFEQVGQSWVKHTFGAKQASACFSCQPGGDFTHLGVGCSDTYFASQSADQALLGSRAWINPFTGIFPTNARDHTGHVHTAVSHMMLIESNDLNQTLNQGATYYAELLYVTPDEYAWCQTHAGECNMSNNSSYRKYSVSGTTSFTFSPVAATVRMTPPINAWTGAITSQIEPVPGVDGRAFIAYKVTGPVAGVYHYEYAIYNQDLDRAIQSFSVPLGCGITVSNLGFHAPLNHPGFPNDGTQGDAGFSNVTWAANQTADDVSWSSETFAQNQNANAIRWGTLYNFRFDSDHPPVATSATIGFFKTGTPITVAIQGPSPCGATPSPTPTATATVAPSASPTPTPTASGTGTPSATPTPSVSATPSPVPTPFLPPAGNGKIAFQAHRDGNWEIYTMNDDGSNQTNLTNNPAADEDPAWSPDGTKIAFASNRDGNYEVYIMNADGSNPVRVTNAPATDHGPRWSPDGTKFVFYSDRDGFFQIYVMNIDGSNPVRLTNNSANDFEPTWSPDGGKIAFYSDRDVNNEVYVMNADGSNQINLTNRPGTDSDPAWSPDGTKIAYHRSSGGGGIYVMSAYGANPTSLTTSNTDQFPVWSPDGTKIAYLSRPVNSEIFVMNADGTNRINLTNATGEDIRPDWQRLPMAAQPLNLSTRLRVQTGDSVGIGGFIITGTAQKQVVLRGIGPSLAGSGVPDPLADPVLELHGPPGFVTVINDNWRDFNCTLNGIAPPTNDLESRICATLTPGAYTAILRGNNATSGTGLVEVYDVNQTASSKLANISTRGFVSTGADIMIAGFILGNSSSNDTIVVRGIGPSLTAFGVPNALANPALELRDSNGALLILNNDWQDDPAQAAELTAAGLALTNPLESGIATSLPPGLYTALLSGTNSGTGIGLVEVYDLGGP